MPIVIHKTKREKPCDLYGPDDELIGQIKDQYSLYDVLTQIQEQQAMGYYLIYNKERIPIDQNGNLKDYPNDLFSKLADLLLKHLMFEPNKKNIG